MSKNNVNIIGILAIITGIISFIPVIYIVYKTKKTNDFAYYTLYLAITSNLLWILYGVNKKTYANILSGILYFIIYTFILYIKLFN